MDPLMNEERLEPESTQRAALEATLADYLALGFIPTFFDIATQTFHPACASPLHIPGFERDGYFYTRTTAARAVAEWSGAR